MDEGAVAEDEFGLLAQERIAGLMGRRLGEQELQQLLDKKAACICRRGDVVSQGLAGQAERDKAALSRALAEREFDLSKAKVDLLRWRQRSALLKVQLSSAEEDVKRYQRVGAIMLRQYELEQAAKLGAQQAEAAQQQRAAELSQQQAAVRQADLESAKAALKDQQQHLARLQQELELSAARESDLERHLVAAQDERARLELSAAAVGERAAALQQEVQQLKEANARLETQCDDTKAAAAQRQADAKELQNQAKKLQQEVATKDAEIASLQARLSAEEQLAADLKAQLQSKDMAAADLKAQLQSKDKAAADLKAQLQSKDKVAAELEAQLANRKAQISQLEEEAAARTVGAFISQLESPLVVDPRADAQLSAHANTPEASSHDTARLAAGKGHAAGAMVAARAAPPVAEPKQFQHADARAAGQKKPAVRKRKNKHVEEAMPAAVEVAGAEGQAGRLRRDRSKAQPYWLGALQPGEGGAQQARPENQAAGAPAAATAAAPQLAAADAAAEEVEQPVEPAHGKQGAAAHAGDHAAEQEPANAGENRRQKVQPVGLSQEEVVVQQVAQDAAAGEVKAQKGKGRKAQLKRPQGEIKTNLTNVWGGATPVPAAKDENDGQDAKAGKPMRKSNLAPKGDQPQVLLAPEAAGSSQDQQAPAAATHENRAGKQPPRGSQGLAPGQQQEVTSRVQERPLAALNQRTLAVAANMMHRPAGPIKANLQKVIAARGGQAQQPNKRKLLPVSTSYGAAAGDALPAEALFGGAFKVPRLAK